MKGKDSLMMTAFNKSKIITKLMTIPSKFMKEKSCHLIKIKEDLNSNIIVVVLREDNF
jgi:hypothetical protein